MRTNSFAGAVAPDNPWSRRSNHGGLTCRSAHRAQNPFAGKFQANWRPANLLRVLLRLHDPDCPRSSKGEIGRPGQDQGSLRCHTRGKHKCISYADCKQLLDAGKSIEYGGASAALPHMNKFGTFEPNAGVNEIWSFDSAGTMSSNRPARRSGAESRATASHGGVTSTGGTTLTFGTRLALPFTTLPSHHRVREGVDPRHSAG